MFVNFDEEVRRILKRAVVERNMLKHPYVGSEHLFLALLKENKFLNNYGINYDSFKQKIIEIIGVGTKENEFILYTPLLKRVIENSVIEAREQNIKMVTPKIIILMVLEETDGIANNILKNLNVNIDKLYFDLKINKKNQVRKNRKSILNEVGVDLCDMAKKGKLDPVIGRDKEILDTMEILLRKKKNNPILVGPAGVGKTAIVEGIASMIANNNCPIYFKNKKIISLNIFSLVSGTKYRGEFEEKMKNLIKELEENENIILFIDEIHTIVGAGGAEGAIDASNILKPALARGTIKVIGATTMDEYKKYIEPDTALSRRFQNVIVNEPSYQNVVKILKGLKPYYEKYHNIKIDNELIKLIVSLSQKYIKNRFEPDRSIDILDEVCVKASFHTSKNDELKKLLSKKLTKLRKEKIDAITKSDFKKASMCKQNEEKIEKEIKGIKIFKKKVLRKDIIDIVMRKGKINFLSVNKNLYNILNKKIIGQENNIDKIIKLLLKKEYYKSSKVYSVLISGEKGSGKTFFAKTILEKLMDKRNIITIDLSLYNEPYTLNKLIDNGLNYKNNTIFEKIKSNPSSGILIENFSDACYEVQNLFFKILDNGYVEDGYGNKIDFTNSIIMFTNIISGEKNLGFNNSNNTNSDDLLDKKVLLDIKLNKLNEKLKNKIIVNEINHYIKNYNLNINIDNEYYNYVCKKLVNKEDLNEIIKALKDDIDNYILNNIEKGKKKVVIS